MKSPWCVAACFCCLSMFPALALSQDQAQSVGQKARETLPAAKVDPNQPGPVGAQPQDQEGTVDEGFALKRMQWFVRQRAYPNEHIPSGARWNALQQHEALRFAAAARMAGGAHPLDAFTSPVWSSVGPAALNSNPAFSGRATSIAIDPNTPSTIYLGTAAGGVWKSLDSGTSWKPLSDSQASLAIGALAIDPTNTSVIYAGTGEPDYSGDSYYGQGLLKSTDGGATWTLIRTPFTTGLSAPDFTQIALQPGNSSVVVASTLSGVYRSADAGATWTKVLSLATTSVLFDNTTSSVMYAGINGAYSGASATSAVYKSTNAGLTWTPMPGTGSSLLPAVSAVLRTSLAEDSTGANLYASMANSSYNGPGTIYKSTDGGSTWTKLGNPSSVDVSDWYRDGLAVVPNTNPNVLFEGGVRIWQSLDGGVTWAVDTRGGYYSDQHAFVPSPDGSHLYVADDGGISVTATPGTANPVFTSLNNGISDMTFYPGFSLVAGQPNSALAGTQDHGLDLYANSLTWSYGDNDRFCGDGGGAYVDPQNSHSYAHCQGGSANWVANASGADSTTTYVSAQAGIDTTADRVPWVVDIKGDPENIAIVYTGTDKLYQSTNYAGLWTAISPDLTGGSASINTIAVSPTSSNVVYTGAGDGTVEVTNNALSGVAATWTKLAGLPNRGISKIIVAPDSPQDVYVAVGGFGTGHLYNSTNGGSTWADLSGNLPNTPLNSFLLDPSLLNTIYAATDTGVYYTTNKGSTWAILGTGLPNVVIQDILMYPSSRQIRVISHGRGAWDVTVAITGFTALPSALSFAPQLIGSNSTAQTATLYNYVGTAVSIASVSIAGANASQFAQTNTCGTLVAALATCSVSVTFMPNAAGSATATISITDNAASSPQTVSLGGTSIAPYSLSATPSTASIAAGATATYTVQLTATPGYPLGTQVLFGCTGNPSRSICTVTPTSVAAGASAQAVTVTVATTATVTTGQLEMDPLRRGGRAFTFAALFGVFCLGLRLRGTRSGKGLLVLLIAASGTMLLLSGCSNNKSSGPTTVVGTPSGSYTVAISAQAPTYQATQNLTLTVQ